MTSIFFEYGLANQVELPEGRMTLFMASRNSFNYQMGADNSVWENMGKADRQWRVAGGPVSLADLAKLETLVDSTTQVHLRGPITSDADIHVLVISVEVDCGTDTLLGTDTVTKALYPVIVVREAV